MYRTLQKATRKILQIFYINCKIKRWQIFRIDINKKYIKNMFNL